MEGPDAEMLAETLEKRNLLQYADGGEALCRSFTRSGEALCLQTIKTRNSDRNHIVIGFCPIEQ